MDGDENRNLIECEVGPCDQNESNNNAIADATDQRSTPIERVHIPRRRRRPRTKAFRMHIKDEIEKALCCRLSPLYHIPFILDANGRMSAPLDDVITSLGLDGDKYRALSRVALCKLGDMSTLFSIDAPDGAPLRICLNDVNKDLHTATVYVDNLPRDCDVTSLYRRATAFGTVVSLRPLFVHRKSTVTQPWCTNEEQQPSTSTKRLPNVGQHVQAAFIQFVRPESAVKFCEAYSKNWPVKHLCKRRKVRMAKRGLIGRRRYHALLENNTAEKTVAETKKSRKRKRVASELSDEEAPLKRSRSSLTMPEYSEIIDGLSAKVRDDEQQYEQVQNNDRANYVVQENATTKNLVVHRETKKRRRRVKKRCGTKLKLKRRAVNLTRYFRHMQVLSHQTFKDLRAKYLELKRDSFKKLKADLRSEGFRLNMNNDGGKDCRRKRGRAKLMSRVVALREQYDREYQSSPPSSDAVKEDPKSCRDDHLLSQISETPKLC